MINISELTMRDISRWVVYRPEVGTSEKGRIKSWNDKFIFVVYKCDGRWNKFYDYTGCATDPDRLTFASVEEWLKNGKALIKIIRNDEETAIL
jgi:hypothetical protein